jgi:DNA-binding transcriptional MerR regulator
MPKVSEDQLTKLYYSIGEVAGMFEVNTSLIRFWEKEFPTISPKKNKKGKRLFTPKDILKIERIYILVKEEGYTLDGAKKALNSKSANPSVSEQPELTEPTTNNEVIDRLEVIKKRLIGLRTN